LAGDGTRLVVPLSWLQELRKSCFLRVPAPIPPWSRCELHQIRTETTLWLQPMVRLIFPPPMDGVVVWDDLGPHLATFPARSVSSMPPRPLENATSSRENSQFLQPEFDFSEPPLNLGPPMATAHL
jgi:hypothetical protein